MRAKKPRRRAKAASEPEPTSEPASPAPQRAWSPALVTTLVALVVTVAVFAPAIGDEFAWDDHGLIRTNTHIQDPAHYGEALSTHYWNISNPAAADTNAVYDHLYRPVVTLAFIVQYALFGPDATGYRVVSLALHLLCAWLCLGWLQRRLPTATGIAPTAIVGLGLLLFAIHPSRAESVSWISGSTELWWCLWLLLAAAALDAGRRWTAGLLLALALLSKETAIVAAPLLLADLALRGKPVGRQDVAALGAPVAAAFALRTLVVGLGPEGARWEGAPTRALASAGLYLKNVVAPFDPTAFPGLRVYTCDGGEQLDGEWLVYGAALLALCIAVGVLAAKRASWRPAASDLLWFIVPLVPVLNVVDIGARNLVADRFLYVPLLGVAALMVRGLIAYHAHRPPLASLAAGALGLLLAAFAVVTASHAPVFETSSTLWEYERERDPDNALALHSVGVARVRAGLFGSGLGLLSHACRLTWRTCVEQDVVQCNTDLAWALAWTTGADDVEGLDRLHRGYANAEGSGRLVLGMPRRPFVVLELPERALRHSQAHYVFPFALVSARRGAVDEARRMLTELARREPLDASSTELLARLEAATGSIPETPNVDSTSELPVVFEALSTALADPAALPRAELAAHALGFGPPATLPAGLTPSSRATLEALRALHTFNRAPEGRVAPELRELLDRQRRAWQLDEQLVALESRGTL